MSPAQEQGWKVLLNLGAVLGDGWCVIGGQMVWLLAAENGVDPPRATDDVDVRSRPGGPRRICGRSAVSRSTVSAPKASGIVLADPGPGRVVFDVLAPDHLGARADLTTTPPARTLEVPGSRVALDHAERVEVKAGRRTGFVWRPSLIAAIEAKAAAARIATRTTPERDWTDAAFLLSLVADPLGLAASLTRHDRRRLLDLEPLLDARHWAWQLLGRDRARLGQASLQLLLGVSRR